MYIKIGEYLTALFIINAKVRSLIIQPLPNLMRLLYYISLPFVKVKHKTLKSSVAELRRGCPMQEEITTERAYV